MLFILFFTFVTHLGIVSSWAEIDSWLWIPFARKFDLLLLLRWRRWWLLLLLSRHYLPHHCCDGHRNGSGAAAAWLRRRKWWDRAQHRRNIDRSGKTEKILLLLLSFMIFVFFLYFLIFLLKFFYFAHYKTHFNIASWFIMPSTSKISILESQIDTTFEKSMSHQFLSR